MRGWKWLSSHSKKPHKASTNVQKLFSSMTWHHDLAWSIDNTNQESLWRPWNPSQTTPFKGLKGQCNLFSGHLNEILAAPGKQTVFKLTAWLPSSLPSSRHPPKRGVFVLWLLKSFCKSVGQNKIKTSGSLVKGLPPFWKRLQLVKLLSLLSLWLNHARALLSMWNHD